MTPFESKIYKSILEKEDLFYNSKHWVFDNINTNYHSELII
jgi:hypothetical protein